MKIPLMLRLLFAFSILLSILTLVPSVSSVHAACRCIASSSAVMQSKGVWTSVADGGPLCDTNGAFTQGATCDAIRQGYINTPFCVPTLPQLMGNLVRLFFFVAGLLAVAMLLLGGFEWVSSGGDEKKIKGGQSRMTAAVIGLVIMVVALSTIVVVEQVVFGGKLCLGITCPLDMRRFVLVGDGSSYSGRTPCTDFFGSSSSSPIASDEAQLTTIPTSGITPRVITATPLPQQQNQSTPPRILPGTGGGAGAPPPPVPTW